MQLDRWSDHDVFLIIRDGSLDKFYPSQEWLKPLGEIFAIQQNADEIHANVKVIFSDFRKIDLVIATRSNAEHELKFITRQKIIFSKNESVTKLLNDAPLSLPYKSSYQFEQLVNDFWYWSFVAVTRTVRNDLLASLSLALELYRKCLSLCMWLRDRETGTDIHRIGGVKNELLEKMNIQLNGTSKKDIIALVEQCGKEFDKLAFEWNPEYKKHFPIFEKLLILAEEDLSTS
ncbi:MAG TPA: aminoglycoside 6-adenylyltransferase [Patescibacteria group bacterium]|nr:aminoglycoside 6-adenylyltransferase [Patescibacteria group bacterium]